MMTTKRFFGIIVLTIISALLISACALTPSPPEAPAIQAEEAEHDDGDEHEEEAPAAETEEHADDDEHGEEEEADTHPPDDHMSGGEMHSDIPDEAAAVPNPIEANDESIAAGGQIYAASCAVCHGETGEGDGPGAAGLETPPANLNDGHVQENSDGAMFYIISHGKPDSPMPAWDNVLNEEERWQVVNFIRTFNDGEMDGEHDDGGEHDDDDEHAEDREAGAEHDDDEGEHDDGGEHTEDDEN